jgi:hypothetical protein
MKRPAATPPTTRGRAKPSAASAPVRSPRKTARPTATDDVEPAASADSTDVVAEAELIAAAPDLGGSAEDAAIAEVDAAPVPAEQIQIEIDPAVSAGFINNRYDLEVRGWVVASSPVEEVALLHADAIASRVQYGPLRLSQRITLGDGVIVTRHVFALSLPGSRT